jgi:hypothetical protein
VVVFFDNVGHKAQVALYQNVFSLFLLCRVPFFVLADVMSFVIG